MSDVDPLDQPRTRPRRRALMHLLGWLCRLAVALLFLVAVTAKIYYASSLADSFFKNMPMLVGDRLALPVAYSIISAEALVVVLILIPRTARVGCLLAATLLLTFSAYALFYRFGLHNPEGLDCGCFGRIIGSQLGVTTALRNLLLLVPVAFGWYSARRVLR